MISYFMDPPYKPRPGKERFWNICQDQSWSMKITVIIVGGIQRKRIFSYAENIGFCDYQRKKITRQTNMFFLEKAGKEEIC